MTAIYNQIAGQGVGRLAALSDGIFAVAMTLLVFDLRSPDTKGVETEVDLIRTLVQFAPQLILLAMSFLTLGIFWLGQQTQIHHLARSNYHFAWIQIAFLFMVSLIPFSTRVLLAFFHFRLAIVLYWANIMLLGIVLYGSWVYAERAGLAKEDLSAEVGVAIRSRIKNAQVLYAVGLTLCLIHTAWSVGFFVLIQLSYASGFDLHIRRFDRQAARKPMTGESP